MCSIGDLDAHNNLGLTCTPEIKKGVLDPQHDRWVARAPLWSEDALCTRFISRRTSPACPPLWLEQIHGRR